MISLSSSVSSSISSKSISLQRVHRHDLFKGFHTDVCSISGEYVGKYITRLTSRYFSRGRLTWNLQTIMVPVLCADDGTKLLKGRLCGCRVNHDFSRLAHDPNVNNVQGQCCRSVLRACEAGINKDETMERMVGCKMQKWGPISNRSCRHSQEAL